MNRLLPTLAVLALFGGGCVLSSMPSSSSTDTPQTPSASKTTLDLSNRGLTSIPADVFSRTDLEALNLSGNKLSGAPQAEIRHLQNLKSLDLSGNALTGLPAELGQLKQLETLDVAHNQLTGLPLELGNLTQLKLLDVSGNPYSEQDLDTISKKLINTEIRK